MEPEATHHSSDGHEPNAVSVRAIRISGVGLLVLIIATFFLILGMWQLLAGTPEWPTDAARDADLTDVHLDLPPTVPQLNPDQSVELDRLRAAEQKMLNEYGWVNAQHEEARIPIERAIEIVSQTGLPPVVGVPATAEGASNE